MKRLHKIKRLNEIEKRYYVFDVETRGLSARPASFVFGCILGYNYRHVFYSISEFLEILNDTRFDKCTIFAHNAEFDLTTIFGHIIKNLDAKAIFNNRFICARYKKFLFADSFNVFPFSVAKIGDQIGLPKMGIDEGFKDGTIAQITHNHIEYCFRDCEIIYLALQKIFTITGAVKITLAGLALAYFRNSYIESSINSDDNLIYEFFKSYYGGRVEAFKIGKVRAFKYDVNSMYPYAMKHAVFPNPQFLKDESNPTIGKLEYLMDRHEGLATITVKHDKTKIGTLPYRINEKLCFPAGQFTGTWNFNEIRSSILSGKVRVLKVLRIIHGPKYQSPFSAFVDEIYDKRQNAKGIDKVIYKLILNSLYGKFAQKIRWDEQYFERIPYDKIKKLIEQDKEYEIGMFSKDRNDCFLRIKKERMLHHTIPIFSSYITSFARGVLLDYMMENEKVLVYVDTDSICLTKENRRYNSSKLGEMKKEAAVITEILGNKSYREQEAGKEKWKLKGVPYKAVKNMLGDYEFNKMAKTKESLRRDIDPGNFSIHSKTLSFNYDKRTVRKNGRTSILNINDNGKLP